MFFNENLKIKENINMVNELTELGFTKGRDYYNHPSGISVKIDTKEILISATHSGARHQISMKIRIPKILLEMIKMGIVEE